MKKLYNRTGIQCIIFLICTLFIHLTYTSTQKKILNLSKKVALGKCKNIECAQIRMLSLIHKQHEPLNIQQLDSIVPALCEGDNPLIPHAYHEHFAHSRNILKNIPGFSQTLSRYVKMLHLQDQAKGTAYELLRATDIANQNKSITSLNTRLADHNGKKREFDIITKDPKTGIETYIECKNCNWELLRFSSSSGKRILKQLIHQKEIVSYLITQNSVPKTFEVHSAQPVSAPWQEWFNAHNIPFIYAEISHP